MCRRKSCFKNPMNPFFASSLSTTGNFTRKNVAIAGAPDKQTVPLRKDAPRHPMKVLRTLFAIAVSASLAVSARAQQTVLRVGHFPNITHAQGLVASQLSREGKGWFEERLGKDVKIEWFVYNAGPSAMEAIAANSIDLTYVGPNPALNLYVKAEGEEVRVVAGAAIGGAALVVQADGRVGKPADFKGRAIGTPQLGGTQDVACRAWLKKQGFRITQLGGDVNVLPTPNPDQLTLFTTNKLDGVWTVEPWVSRLELEAKGKIFLEQKEVITTVLVASVKALAEKRGLVKQFVAAHRELTEWMSQNPADAKIIANAALKVITKKEMPAALIDHAWPRITFTTALPPGGFEAAVAEAQSVGFIRGRADLSRLVVAP